MACNILKPHNNEDGPVASWYPYDLPEPIISDPIYAGNVDTNGMDGKNPGYGYFVVDMSCAIYDLNFATNARKIFDEAKTQGTTTTIFQKLTPNTKGSVDASDGDGLRSQLTLPFDEYCQRDSVLNPAPHERLYYPNCLLLRDVLKAMTRHDIDRVVTNITLIQSEAGCEQQAFHTDFNPEMEYDPDSPPASILFNFGRTDMFLDVRDETTHVVTKVPIPSESMLYFGGFVQHRGCAYETTHLRLHAYIKAIHNNEVVDVGDETLMLCIPVKINHVTRDFDMKPGMLYHLLQQRTGVFIVSLSVNVKGDGESVLNKHAIVYDAHKSLFIDNWVHGTSVKVQESDRTTKKKANTALKMLISQRTEGLPFDINISRIFTLSTL